MRGIPLPVKRLLALAAASAVLGGATVVAKDGLTAGPQGDGRGVTPNGWLLTPAG